MEVAITELVKHITKLVDRAEHGEEIVITRHGKAVAKLVQVQPKERPLGSARHLIKEIDPDWWKPMSAEEAESFYRGDY